MSRSIVFVIFLLFYQLAFAKQELIIEPDMGRAPIINAIKNAQSSVDVVMYGFTDLDFVDALAYAKQHNKNVNVLLQHYPYLAHDENKRAINALNKEGISLRWPDNTFKLTHQKTVILDNNKAIIMTFNFTHSTFSKERNFAIVISEPNDVQEIKKTFTADWNHSSVSVSQADLIWSPDNSREKILSLIQAAKSDIKIYAEGLSDYQVIGALAKASRRGVKVQILTSTFKVENKPDCKLEYLKKAGVEIHFSQNYIIHAKMLLVDHTKAVLGSINLTKPSLDSNRELSIITYDAQVLSMLEKTFNHDWSYSNNSSSVISTNNWQREAHHVKKLLHFLYKLTYSHHPLIHL